MCTYASASKWDTLNFILLHLLQPRIRVWKVVRLHYSGKYPSSLIWGHKWKPGENTSTRLYGTKDIMGTTSGKNGQKRVKIVNTGFHAYLNEDDARRHCLQMQAHTDGSFIVLPLFGYLGHFVARDNHGVVVFSRLTLREKDMPPMRKTLGGNAIKHKTKTIKAQASG